MAGIYNADIFCDQCVAEIKQAVAAGCILGENEQLSALLDWQELRDSEDLLSAVVEALDALSESDYDSDEYPKWADDDSESDSPQHCGSGENCLNCELLADRSRVGHCFGNSLTSDGVEYVKKEVREARLRGESGGVAIELWAEVYSYLDFDVSQCETCGAWVNPEQLDDNGDCVQCSEEDEHHNRYDSSPGQQFLF